MGKQAVDHRDPEWALLSNFLGAYLHQDFDLEYAEPWDAVIDYCQGAPAGRRTAVADQVRRLLTMSETDADIDTAADSLGMAYDPTGDGYSSYRLWLTAVADFLEDPVAQPGPPERDAPLPTTEGAGGRVSTFTDREVAERSVTENIQGNRSAIDEWRRYVGPNRAFEWQHAGTIGRLAPPDATPESIHDVDRSRVILRRTAEAPEGWFVMVSYPVANPDPDQAGRIDRTAPEWEALWSLLGGYLHQDFDIHGGVAGAVSAFESDAREGQRQAASTAIRGLLDGGDESSLAAATEWLGMDYYPPGDGLTYRSWLSSVADRLET